MTEKRQDERLTKESVQNLLLRGLGDKEFTRIAESLEFIQLEIGQLLFDVNTPIEHVYFIEEGVASIVGIMSDGSAVETATVGPEGMIGLPLFHGTNQTSAQAFCQVPGSALRMSARAFSEEINRPASGLTFMLHRYAQALFTLIAQSSACNRLHTMRERCARWLLHTHDRVQGDEFKLTHQFLSQMLGVRRATVTEALGALQDGKSITYAMGTVAVIDRARLENSACECYAIIQSEFERLLDSRGPERTPNPLDGIRTGEKGFTTIGDAVPDPGDPEKPA